MEASSRKFRPAGRAPWIASRAILFALALSSGSVASGEPTKIDPVVVQGVREEVEEKSNDKKKMQGGTARIGTMFYNPNEFTGGLVRSDVKPDNDERDRNCSAAPETGQRIFFAVVASVMHTVTLVPATCLQMVEVLSLAAWPRVSLRISMIS